ncbi:YolD-like family protein [Bacillus massiliigorillae]|uniref:YolD-like family protein n=1 Tax=Bacillus massiliigorillae TaxID=1243664 RepID=UPI00039F8032|nr:YolD-like family protein [Bacillus massiliigorillae]
MGLEKLKESGKMIWHSAFSTPNQQQMIKVYKDYDQSKLLLDESEIEEIEAKIHYAMAFDLIVKIFVWTDGFEEIYRGKVDYFDNIHKKIRLIEADEDIAFIRLEEVIMVIVEE